MNLSNIVYAKNNHFVLRTNKQTFEVYRCGITAATRCAIIGYTGDKGFKRAVSECDKREEQSPSFGIVSTPKQPRVIGIQRELEPLNAAGIKYAAYLTEPDGPNDYRLTTPLYLSGETLEAVKVRVLGVEKVSAWFYAYRITDFIEPIRTA